MPNDRNRNRVYSPWSNIVVQTGWSVSAVRAAIASHEIADFTSSGLLIDMLGRDDRLGSVCSGVIGTRANGLLGKPFSLKPADDSDRAQQIADEIEAVWWEILPESELKVMLRYLWLGGGAPAELCWKLVRGRWQPRVVAWQLHHMYHTDDADPETNQLFDHFRLNTRSGPVSFTPGDGKWLLLADGERWWLNGSVRSLAVPWLGKQFAFRDWLRHSERLGHPIIKAMHPAMAEAPEVDDWFDDLKALAAETTAKLPQNTDNAGTSFDLDLLESAGQNWESFQGLIAHVDTLYAVHLLGHNLTTEVTGGSFAAAKIGQEVRVDYVRADAETLSTGLRTQLLGPICDEWYSEGAALAPWPCWEVDPPSDTKEQAETAKLAGEALQSLETAGYRPTDITSWGERFGIEIEPIPENELRPPAPAPSPSKMSEGAQLYLASGDPLQSAPGFVGGQLFADRIVEEGLFKAQRAMSPDIKAILEVVDGVLSEGGDQQLMTDRLVELYRGMKPGKLAELLEKAEILAEMRGVASVLEDL